MPKDIVVFNPRGVRQGLLDFITKIAGPQRTVLAYSDDKLLFAEPIKFDGLVLNSSEKTVQVVLNAQRQGIHAIALLSSVLDLEQLDEMRQKYNIHAFALPFIYPGGSMKRDFEEFIRS